jgi:hypothetical protein
MISHNVALCAKTGRFVNNFAHDEMNVPALSQRYLTLGRVLPLPAAGKWPSLRRRCSQQRNNDAWRQWELSGNQRRRVSNSSSTLQFNDSCPAGMTPGRRFGILARRLAWKV